MTNVPHKSYYYKNNLDLQQFTKLRQADRHVMGEMYTIISIYYSMKLQYSQIDVCSYQLILVSSFTSCRIEFDKQGGGLNW